MCTLTLPYPVDRDVNVLEKMTREDVLSYYKKHCAPGSTERRKISIHLRSQRKPKADEKDELEMPARNTEVEDVVQFKKGMMVSTSSRPLENWDGNLFSSPARL